MQRILFFIIGGMLVFFHVQAQKKISETFDAGSMQRIDLIFEYPKLVKISTWDKAEVKIEGLVEICEGEFDDDFRLKSRIENGKLTIESEIDNIKKYKDRYVYTDDDDQQVRISRNGTTITVGSKENNWSVNGVRVAIELEVTVPRSMEIHVDAKYGLVEVLETAKSMNIVAKFGGVDVTIDESGSLEFAAQTQWGEIFSNLDVETDIDGDDRIGKTLKAKASLNRGDNKLWVESRFGNVYLRKHNDP